MPDRPITATYRLQLHADLGFDAARTQVPYLASLGVSHLYLSPILQAAPGSMHGYDVVDHGRVSDDLGGRDALLALADEAHRHDLGIVVDVVPNHMAFPTPAHLNPAWWEVLRDGPDAERAHWFDVDWAHGGTTIGLPILGDRLGSVLERGELSVETTDSLGAVLRYYDQMLPIAVGTEHGDVADVLARQHYRLESWRLKDDVLNYRRFFDVDTLVAVRVELPDVFEATHRVLLDLHAGGVVDGFRIDHPDGLADPEGYLERLRDATGGAWVVVEKILAPGERLPSSWPTDGTTGYDAIRVVDAALAPAAGPALADLWRDELGAGLAEVEERAKREVVHDLFGVEVSRLARSAGAALARRDLAADPDEVRLALSELLAHVRTYRAYVRLDRPAPAEAIDQLHTLRDAAIASRPALASVVGAVVDVLLDPMTADPDARDLVVRFQQVCGPVMAKGVEDTTFYRFNRFIALNEVGGDPDTLVTGTPTDLHAWAELQASSYPRGLTTLSTHDTKRDEDVRARLFAAGDDAERWHPTWGLVRRRAAQLDVDARAAYFVLQTVLGAWPIDADRLDAYLVKAAREAKVATTWIEPDEDYEARLVRLGRACREEPELAEAFEAWADALAPAERAANLAVKLVQLTLPGVPDVYRGCDLVARRLVDPDNRAPVDFAARSGRLAELDDGDDRSGLGDDKLWLTSRVLRLRRELPDAFGPGADYAPFETGTEDVLGFVRDGRVLTLVPRWFAAAAMARWREHGVVLPDGEWSDVLTAAAHRGSVSVADLFAELPVALLRREETP